MPDPEERTDHLGNLLPPTACPTCGYEMDSATFVTHKKERPAAGDVTLCARCGEILEFDAELKPRLPTLASMLQWPPDVNRTVALAQHMIRKTRGIK